MAISDTVSIAATNEPVTSPGRAEELIFVFFFDRFPWGSLAVIKTIPFLEPSLTL
jgi:hypothetical protein